MLSKSRKKDANMSGLQFTGRWIGETIGHESPAHVWEISVQGAQLRIQTRWENQAAAEGPWSARLLPDGNGFRLGRFTATLVDAQHFVIWGWDTNDTRGGQGPDFDVVFSRPGVAELTAHSAYARAVSSRNATSKASSSSSS
jgi:hypothetical protein